VEAGAMASCFKETLFLDPEEFEEGLLRDRKRELPNLFDPGSRVEFIKDVIAFANTARRFGKAAYLLYGIDDAMEILGLEESIGPYEAQARSGSYDIEMSEDRYAEHLWKETVQKMMLQAIEEYIDPELGSACQLCRGYVRERLCAHLRVPPLRCSRHFVVRRQMKGKGKVTVLEEGLSWIRRGESKSKLERSLVSEGGDDPYLYSAHDVPSPLTSDWKRYFEKLEGEYHRYDAFEFPGYQQLLDTEGFSLANTVGEFLSAEEDQQLLVIRGAAGSGKTMFLKRLVSSLAQSGSSEMYAAREAEVFLPEGFTVPVYISLRHWHGGRALSEEVIDEVNKLMDLWDVRPKRPSMLLDDRAIRWLVIFDGLDEIWDRDQRRAFNWGLAAFRTEHRRVKILLTMRPDVSFSPPEHQPETRVEVSPLSMEQIEDFLAVSAHSEDQIDDVTRFIQSHEDMPKLCSTPLFLVAAADAWWDEFEPLAAETESPEKTMPIAAEISASLDSPGLRGIPGETYREIVEGNLGVLVREEASEDVAVEDDNEGAENPSNEVEDSEVILSPIRIGRVLDRIYKRLWVRERERRNLGEENEIWLAGISKLAAEMDGKRDRVPFSDAEKCIEEREGVHTALSLGILMRLHQGGRLLFATRTTKALFASNALIEDVEQGCFSDVVKDYGFSLSEPFWVFVKEILEDRTYGDLTELLANTNTNGGVA
jgi:hypothetical protein